MYSTYRTPWFGHKGINSFNPLNPYGVAKWVVLIIGVLLIVLISLDWAFPGGTRATQLKANNVDRVVPQVIRGFMLLLMLGYINLTGWYPGSYGFAIGHALFLLSIYMFVSVLFAPSDLITRLFIYFKSLLWIAAAIASYRLTLGGYLTNSKIRYLAGVVIIIASVYTIQFCFDPSHRVGQNADSSMLLWCIPLILLGRTTLQTSAWVGLASIAVLVTVKRGAVLALLTGGLLFFALSIYMSSRKHKVRDFVMVGLIIVIMASGFLWQWKNLESRMVKDFDRGTIGSGRLSYYPIIIEEWYNSGPFSLLFGKGFFTVCNTLDNKYGQPLYAHSDWLEILHDMGIFGIALFAYLHSRILLTIRQALWQRDFVAPALAMGYCIFALRNIYSMCVVGEVTTMYFGILLGYSAATVSSGRQLSSHSRKLTF